MTNEEAIQILNLYDLGNTFLDIDGNPISPEKMANACDMAVLALKEHNNYKTAWENLKERIKEERKSCTGKSILFLEREETLTYIIDCMNASDEEIKNCHIACGLKETENDKRKSG